MDGVDMARLLETRRLLPVAEAVDLALQAIEGLAEAHANGIVHRDLKPANLFITVDSDGSALVKVLDFGISKSSVAGNATRTGEIMGSPSYMAPEQMQSSKSVDGRADVWAMGVILYEATSGLLPFRSDSLPALCVEVMLEPAPPLHGVPPPFAAIVMRCLSKAPGERFADVGELAIALAPFGGPDAVSSASRIVKVLRRSKPSAQLAPAASAMKTVLVEDPKSAPPVPASASVVRQSTLSGSASESLRIASHPSEVDVVPAHRASTWNLAVAFIGTAAVAVLAIVGVTSLTKGGDKATSKSAAPAAVPALAPAATPRSSTTPAPLARAPAPTPPPAEIRADPPGDSAKTTQVRPSAAPPTSNKNQTSPSRSSATKTSSRSSWSPTSVRLPAATSATTMSPPVATPAPSATSAPVGWSNPRATTTDGKPIYKGTKGTVITTYPDQ